MRVRTVHNGERFSVEPLGVIIRRPVSGNHAVGAKFAHVRHRVLKQIFIEFGHDEPTRNPAAENVQAGDIEIAVKIAFVIKADLVAKPFFKLRHSLAARFLEEIGTNDFAVLSVFFLKTVIRELNSAL